MIQKLLTLLIVFSIIMMPIASVSAKTVDTSNKAISAVRRALPANVKIKNYTKTNISLNITKFSLIPNSKLSNLGNISFTRMDSDGVLIQLRTESGKDLEMRVSSNIKGSFSLKIQSGKETANVDFSEISKLSKSTLLNEFSKNLGKDVELSSLIVESAKSLGVNYNVTNAKCFDDGCALAITFCIFALVGSGIAIAGLFTCPETAGLGCLIGAVAGLAMGAPSAGYECEQDVPNKCSGKTSEETGVSVKGGHLIITFDPVLIEEPIQVDCSDPLVHCNNIPSPNQPIKPAKPNNY